jgi:hypothetical protein
MCLSLRGASQRLDVACIRHACYGVSMTESRKHIVDRLLYGVFGLCNLRAALAAKLASRKRFDTLVVALKTSSERIAFSER